MKKLIFLLTACVMYSYGFSQRVTVVKATEKIKSDQVEGAQAQMDASKKELEDAWLKFVKGWGKSKSSGELIEIRDAIIDGESYSGKIVYAKVTDLGKSSVIWMGIREKDWDENYTKVNPFMDRLVKEFCVKFYQEKILAEISESEKALRFAERQQGRLLSEQGDLNLKLEENEREKIQLERSINNNALQNQVLKQKIENNKNSQDSISISLEKIKRMIDMQRERLRQVN
ncbi:MAG TPA: hypothetical protein PKC24_05805 [Cyclobacteriaceae bacterium]|nr:hypothetical protein [Cyclobacteriaceae bacterium]